MLGRDLSAYQPTTVDEAAEILLSCLSPADRLALEAIQEEGQVPSSLYELGRAIRNAWVFGSGGAQLRLEAGLPSHERPPRATHAYAVSAAILRRAWRRIRDEGAAA